jgi:hypothetical protein
MAAAPLAPILCHLRQLAASPDAGQPDVELPRRYSRFREEAAFEELVRYGKAVD